MEKLREVCQGRGKWLLLSLPLAALLLVASLQLLGQRGEPLEARPTESEVTFDLEANEVYSSEDGVVVVQPGPTVQPQAELHKERPEQLWPETEPLSSESYTLPREAALADCLAVLTIPKIKLSAQVFEAENDEMEAMTKGIAHFASTSAWDGNVGLCSHNVAPQGAVAYFRELHLLQKGDEIRYKTALGERSYAVCQVKEIDENDWTQLQNRADGKNLLTLLTCISGKPQLRLLVQAEEIINEERP